ncbi:uncharacterized protein LOC123684788 [Harmonia axyridis]|uniref:uncharacterized protein LOC123684788 n=1 Tax=Harmonia axyridis TaxID=115357 RepID=UPI001E2795E4|nr:uncharacterized protein LOC123684788 [Harmonia axyridis]
MNVLYILLIPLTFVYCQQKSGQYGHNSTVSVQRSVSNIHQLVPTVKAAVKMNVNSQNNLKPFFTQEIAKNNPLVQSYIESRQNSPIRKIITRVGSILKTPIKDIKNTLLPTLTQTTVVNQNKNTVVDHQKTNDSLSAAEIHKQKSAEHLKALRNVISLQLRSYKSDSSSTEVPNVTTTQEIVTKKTPTKEKIKTKRHDSFSKDINKKLAVIAAASALMDILDA